MAQKSLAAKLQQASKDISKEKRPTDKQVLKQKRKAHPGWSDEQIANQYGLSL